MSVLTVYDDTGKKSEVIADIIGDKGFADVVVRKRRLEEYYRDAIAKIYPKSEWRKLRSHYEYTDLLKFLETRIERGDTVKVIHCFSNYIFLDTEKALLTFEKLKYIDTPYRIMDGKKVAAVMFPDVGTYIRFCKTVIEGNHAWDIARSIEDYTDVDGLADIGIVGNFIQCITGDFDSRYFNSLKGNEYTLVKSSADKSKIKAEYTFYHLLPEDMKIWFVMPFHYCETEETASYTMERLHMTDLAIKWVHGSIGETEFERILDKYFYFFAHRHAKPCSEKEYTELAEALYVHKVNDRIERLKLLPAYQKIKSLASISEEVNIDVLAAKYFALKDKIEKRNTYRRVSVIGHGDPCFANTMYNKATNTLKFIDPKGALSDRELWTNEYYDIAKLSHSVCGGYDFFNHALFEIRINEELQYDLDIPRPPLRYLEIFKEKLEENGFDYLTVRIYEASLFLSMLPLHMDNIQKVFGLILNIKNMLEEIEKDV